MNYYKSSISICLILSVLSFTSLVGQDYVIPLWPEGIPCANDWTINIEDQGEAVGRFISKVHEPDIAVYLPENPNGSAVLICPGGGYTILAYDWEGTSFAEWFIERGITAIVLKYRLPHWESKKCRDKVALPDAQRAMRIIRKNAKDWQIDPTKIGVMGFSAGGHLASTLSTQFDKEPSEPNKDYMSLSARPDFSILLYPVISMAPDITHKGSRNNLIGEMPNKESILKFSNELHVSADTPPTLLVHASNDHGVVPENSIRYYQSLLKHKVPAAMHMTTTGGHGFAMGNTSEGQVTKWLSVLEGWLKEQGLL